MSTQLIRLDLVEKKFCCGRRKLAEQGACEMGYVSLSVEVNIETCRMHFECAWSF